MTWDGLKCVVRSLALYKWYSFCYSQACDICMAYSLWFPCFSRFLWLFFLLFLYLALRTFLLCSCGREILYSSWIKTCLRHKLQHISLSTYMNYEYVGHQKMKRKHMFRKWMCWSERLLSQRVIGGFLCSSRTDFFRENKPQWMEWLTKAWGKSLDPRQKGWLQQKQHVLFLYSRDRMCAVCEWQSSFFSKTETNLKVDTGQYGLIRKQSRSSI